MIIVDKALARRVQEKNPICVGLIGAGFSGRNIAYQIVKSFPGLKLVGICNRGIDAARKAFTAAGVTDVREINSAKAASECVNANQCFVTVDADVLCGTEGIEAVIEATGTIEYGASAVLSAIGNRKHIVVVNCELDATVGPILKARADRAGVIYSNSDGDEPGVAMNMIRFVRSIGLKPVVAGNLKGMLDPYRTPETQRAFAEKNNQKANAVTSFADGTKLSMELTVLANATGFGVGKRGAYAAELKHVNDASAFFADKLPKDGMVDFLIGAAPGNGAFVLGFTEDPTIAAYLKYLKMGDGPLYTFYTPFHLPQLEIPLTVARAVLFRDATVAPLGAPVCDSIAIAKKDLAAGVTLDGIGGFCCYTLIENYNRARAENALPMGVSEGCRLIRDVPKDRPLTYDDVELPPGRLCDVLRKEQDELFGRIETGA